MKPLQFLPFALACCAFPSSVVAQGTYPTARHGGNYMHNYYFPPGPTSTPWAPAWAPDGQSIAVSMAGSIWLVDPMDGSAREVTADDRYHSLPAWSPDGRWIAYTADESDRTIDLAILNVATGQTHLLTDDDHVYVDPVFSPDGTKLAYVSTQPNGYFNVYVRSIRDGQWAGEPAAVTSDHNYGRNRLYFGPWDMHLTPAWMPDGESLLILSNRDQALGSGDVLRVPAREQGIDAGVSVLHEQTLYRTRPDVSIDGKRFIYSSTAATADQFNNLYVQPTVGGEPYKMTFFQYDAFHPRWSPDGAWIAYISNEGGLPRLALLETYGGAQRNVDISTREWKRETGKLAVVITDDQGEPTAARLHLTASDGKFYAPHDAYARVGTAGDHVFHADDRFIIELPAGPALLIAVKGFEFLPETLSVHVAPNALASHVIELDRLTNMADRGWFSGSTHVHMNYGGNLHNTLENLMMMSDAEDQDIVNEQVANKDNRILDYQFFIPGGGAHPVSWPDKLLVVGQEYRPPFYGHVFMMGLRDHLISPFVTGYEGTAVESLYPSNTDMLRKAKAQGATTGYVHPYFGNGDPLQGNLQGGKGFLVDAALGTTDALEWSGANRASFFPLYAAWSNDLRVTGTGGEDSISNLHRSKLVGSLRTYVCTAGGQLTANGWYEGLRAGRAFMSAGPLIDMRVDGGIPGTEIHVPADGGAVEVTVVVQSITPLSKMEIVFNGEVLDEVVAEGDRTRIDYRASVIVAGSGWIHARVTGSPEERFPLDVNYAQAFTNPVWIVAGTEPIRSQAAADYGIQWIDKLEELAREWPDWRSESEIDHVMQQFDEARGVYAQRRAEAPSAVPTATVRERSTATRISTEHVCYE